MSGYLSFKRTDVEAIDKILDILEAAGHGYHHTEMWGEDDNGPGTSYIAQIQAAANEAANLAYAAKRRNTAYQAIKDWLKAQDMAGNLRQNGDAPAWAEYQNAEEALSKIIWLQGFQEETKMSYDKKYPECGLDAVMQFEERLGCTSCDYWLPKGDIQ